MREGVRERVRDREREREREGERERVGKGEVIKNSSREDSGMTEFSGQAV